MRRFRLGLLLLCLPLVGCAFGHQIVKVRTVRLAIAPEYSLHVISKKYDPLLRYLSEKTGCRVEPVLATAYGSFLSTVEGSKAEVSFQNALLFTRLSNTKDAYPIAASLSSDGQLAQRGVIVVRRDSGIEQLADLKGKVVMIPAREAVLGYLAQAALLLGNGLDVERDLKIVVATRHDEVLMGVWQGRADAGFVKAGVFVEALGRVNVDELRILARTEPFPNWCFAAFPESDRVVVGKIKSALLGLRWEDPAQRAILEAAGVRGFVDPAKQDLRPVQRAIAALHLPY